MQYLSPYKYLASAGQERDIVVWDPHTGRRIGVMRIAEVRSRVEAVEREQLHDVVSQLLNADPTKRPGASNVLDHPFFEKIQLVEAPIAPTTQPRRLGDGACLLYTVVHGGEQASDAGINWEQIHFNEAAVQFRLMIGAQRNCSRDLRRHRPSCSRVRLV